MTTREVSFRRIQAALITALVIVAGCAAPAHRSVRIAPQFYGVWHNIDARYYNWWEITAGRVINYGVALDNGKCGGREAVIVAEDTLDVPFGNAGAVHLGIINNELIFVSSHWAAVHERVSRETICQRADGTYFDGAPYPSTSK
jgi:hypothetical protein